MLVALLAAVFAGIGWLLADVRGAILFALCSLLAASAAYAVGDRALLGMLGARPFALAEDPLLRSTADRLAAQLEIAAAEASADRRRLSLARSSSAAGRAAPRSSSAAACSARSPGELEAVLAHELAHVRTRDVLTQTSAVLLATTLLELTRLGGFLSRFLLAVLAPVASAFTHLCSRSKRELAADAVAARLADPTISPTR